MKVLSEIFMMCQRSHLVVCAVNVNSFARCRQLFDIAAKSINFDSNFLSYSAPLFLFHFPQNVIILSIRGKYS